MYIVSLRVEGQGQMTFRIKKKSKFCHFAPVIKPPPTGGRLIALVGLLSIFISPNF